MTLILELTPEMEQHLQHEAARHGQQAEAYALSLLRNALPASIYETRTPQERAQAYLEWAHSPVDMTAPPIPDEALRRENMYED